MKYVNVSHIFYDPSVKPCLSTDIKFDDPNVEYSLTNSVSSKTFNSNKLVSYLVIKAFYQGNTILLCNRTGSGLIDKDHRCVVTGNLQIGGNNKLRKLSTKSSKYRETNHILWKKVNPL